MSVAVQVVNGREQGTEEEELQEAVGGALEAEGGAQEAEGGAMEEAEVGAEVGAEIMEDDMVIVPRIPREDVLSDSELDQSGAPKKKKFKAWKSIKKIFKKKKSSKGSEGDSAPNKSKSKSTSELERGGDGELNKRISMSEDSVFTPDKPASAKDRNSYSLNTSNLADEINAKLKERASSSDDGYAQSSEDAITTGDTTHDNSYVAPSDSSKTDSGIITTEDEKSFTSIGVKDSQNVTTDMKRLKTDNPGDVDLDLIQSSKLLSSSAAKHRISVAPSNRRPSRKARARTSQKRSSSRLDDAPSPIAEEPSTPTKSPAPIDVDNKEKGDTPKNDVPVVIIESPSSDDLKTSMDATLEGESQEDVEEEPMILPQVPKEVIIIMKDDPAKKEDVGTKKEPEKEVKPSTPTTPEPPVTPVEVTSPEEDPTAASPPPQMKKKEEVEKESAETEKDVEEVKTDEVPDDVEERRLSVAASKALFEAKIPAGSEPAKSSNKVVVNGNGAPKTDARRSSQPSETVPETKAEADTKLSEKEEKKEEQKEEKKEEMDDGKEEDDQVFADKEEAEEAKEEPVSLRDRISRYQNLATKTSVKGLTAHVPTRSSPSKQRPASTSNIENKESPKKFAPKVPSKPSSTSSNKPKGSTAMTTEPSRPSTNPSSSSRQPLQPKIDRCMVCDKAVYPNEMSKFEGRVFHRTCQKCSECSRTLTLWNLLIAEDSLFCKQHGSVVKNNQLKEKLII